MSESLFQSRQSGHARYARCRTCHKLSVCRPSSAVESVRLFHAPALSLFALFVCEHFFLLIMHRIRIDLFQVERERARDYRYLLISSLLLIESHVQSTHRVLFTFIIAAVKLQQYYY